MIKKVIRFFDKLEDALRARLSHRPILYALIGGVGVVLFWKGVWEMAEVPGLYGWPSAALGLLLILPTGLFVSFFIGDNIILSGYKREKKLVEKTESELRGEIDAIKIMQGRIANIEATVARIEALHRAPAPQAPQVRKPRVPRLSVETLPEERNV